MTVPTPGAELPPMPGLRRATTARARTVIVTGAAGGVGTTTVAALVADAVGARLGVVVQATDHSGGELATRLRALVQATSRVAVHDLGAHARAAATLAATPETSVLLVASATARGVADGLEALRTLATSPDPGLVARTVVALVDRSARPARPDPAVLRTAGAGAVVVVRRDPALARPGRIDPALLAADTDRAVVDLVSALGW